MNTKILSATWRTGGTGSVGIVLVLSRDEKKRAYIGVAKSMIPENDAFFIAAYGVRLSFKEASAFFEGLKEEEFSEVDL